MKVKSIHQLIFLLLCGWISCKKNQTDQESLPTKTVPISNNSSGLALLTKDDLKQRPKVNPILIDSSDFRINAVRVSLQDYISYETPVLFFELPELADYLEVLRCQADAVIYGGQSLIQKAEMSAASLNEEAAVFGQNNFWEAAIQMAHCKLAITSYRDLTFEDAAAPSGRFFYLLRACVDRDRMTADAGGISVNCSRQVMKSLPLSYNNKRNLNSIKAFERLQQLRSEVDEFGRQITEKTIALQKLLYDCQQTNQVQVVSEDERKGMATIIGLGTSVLAGGLGAAAVGLYEQRKAPTPLTSTTGSGSNKIGTAYKTLSGFFMIGTAGLVSSLIYQYSSSKPNGYPVESKACEDGSLESFVQKIASDEKDQKNLCFCTKALSTKMDITRLRGEFEYRIRILDKETAAVAVQ